jgi:hypothetical protein
MGNMKATHTDYLHPRHLRVEDGGRYPVWGGGGGELARAECGRPAPWSDAPGISRSERPDGDAGRSGRLLDGPERPERRAHRRADNGGVYRHELDDAGHLDLLEALQSLEGMVILSGYPSETYDAALQGWHRVDRAALADGALKRTEVLWLNPAAKRAMPQADLWSSAA